MVRIQKQDDKSNYATTLENLFIEKNKKYLSRLICVAFIYVCAAW